MEQDAFIQEEHKVLRFWQEQQCFAKLRAKAEGRPLFRFLDGPITANNPMGVHHAWGRSLKDIFIRYKFRRGFNCRCQNGFDAQGLWVEIGVEKDLGFASKREIEAFGLDKFTQACKARVQTFAGVITEQSKRLGQWMDWGNDYFTHTDANIEGIWRFLKQCYQNGWIAQQHKPMPWCPRCGTSLSEHEMTGSYQQMTHDSVFLQLPVVGKDFRMLVWTTTPWTLSANVALAVHPAIDYVLVRLKSQAEPVVLAKQALKQLGDDKQDVLSVFKGSELVGLQYETAFPELPALQGVQHRIVAWDEVTAEDGSGVVHIAPGCGAEDFALGQREGLPQPMPVDDLGLFLPGFGFFSGLNSQSVAPQVFDELKARGKLYAVRPHEHSYPVCWRCKTPVLFRLIPAWYITVDDALRARLLAASQTVTWEPASGGKRMEDWLTQMGNWNISRKRYYGLPLPFYPCACGKLTVVGSRQELNELAGGAATQDALPELHRPWIDGIAIACPHCGKPVQRIEDTGDVWLDAGIVPFSTTGYFNNKAAFAQNYPAEWITEMSEQVRLWFYSMLFMSVVLEDRAPYEHVMCYSPVVKEDGTRFSKTGNMIRFDEAAEQMGSDAIRYLFASCPMTNDVRFGFAVGDEARRKLLSFWNIYNFFMLYYPLDRPDLTVQPEPAGLCLLDRWLLARTNQFVAEATQSMEAFKTHALVKAFELFCDDVSNWYVRLSRRRFWKNGDPADKQNGYCSLYAALKTMVMAMAPVLPFMTETVWQSLVRVAEPSEEESVHLGGWPEPLPCYDDAALLEQTARVRELVAAALRLRNEQQIKVRQPLQALFVAGDTQDLQAFSAWMLAELNVKSVRWLPDASALQTQVPVLNFKAAGAVLKNRVNECKALVAGLLEAGRASVAEQIAAGGAVQLPGWEGALAAELFALQSQPKPGLVQTETLGLTLALDTTITEDLRREGALRDLIRQVQILRKDAGYAVEQRVVMRLQTKSLFWLEVVRAAEAELCDEVLADHLLCNQSLAEPGITRELNLGEDTLLLQLRKAD